MTRAAILLGCGCLAVVFSCSPADVAAEKKAVSAAQAKVNAYCDERARLLESLQAPDGGEAESK